MTHLTQIKAGSNSKQVVLFVGEGVTAAHILRPLSLAKQLKQENYEVHFACDSNFKKQIEGSNIAWHSLDSISPELFKSRISTGKIPYTKKELDSYIQDEVKLIKELKPSLIVADFRVSLSISCHLTQTTLINLSNAQWSPFMDLPTPLPEFPANKILGVGVMKTLFKFLKPIIFSAHGRFYNKIRSSYGLKPLKNLEEIYTAADEILFMDSPNLFDHPEHHPDYQFIGPVHGVPETKNPVWWPELPKHRPIIFISPGSSGSSESVLQVIETLREMDVTLIVATAGQIKGLKTENNVYVCDYISGHLAAEVADLVVCNGGSGMVYISLSAGKPVLSLPILMDQYYVAEAVERKGLGAVLRSEKMSSVEIIKKVQMLLSSTEISDKVKFFRRNILKFNSGELFLNKIKEMLPKQETKNTISLSAGPITQRLNLIADDSDTTSRIPAPEIVSVADTEKDLREAYNIVYRQYRSYGYMNSNKLKQRILIWNALPNTTTIISKKAGRITGTLTCIMDSSAGLPMDEVSSKALNVYRRQNRRLCEISGLAVDGANSNFSTVIELIQFLTHTSLYKIKATDWVITVNPRHVSYYENILGFMKIGEKVEYKKVNHAPGVPMRLDLSKMKSFLLNKHGHRQGKRNLHNKFFVDHQEVLSVRVNSGFNRLKKLRTRDFLQRFYDDICLLNGEQDDDIFSRQWNFGKGNRVERVMNLDEEPALSIQS